MRLSMLLNSIYHLPPAFDCDISAITSDSRQIKGNDLFLAIKGTQVDGGKYINDAIKRGARAILVDQSDFGETITERATIPLIPIEALAQKIGFMAAHFYNYPGKQLRMVGVTGTNGKTSCTHFIAQSLEALRIPCGIIGTLGTGFYPLLKESIWTTPDAISLQATLAQFVSLKAAAIAMEVSSHGIDQGRVNGIDFEVGVFTNLTQDHLDYHGDMQTYAAVKKRFLAELPTKNLVINADDAYGKKWLNDLSTLKPVFGFATQKLALNADIPLIYAEQVELHPHCIKANVVTPWGEGALSLPLLGRFNLSNVLASLTALCVLGVPFRDALAQMTLLKPVPGRMQVLGGHDKPTVIVDYSHTPDALYNALNALRAHTNGKLFCVFGCGGNRDSTKRPLMAQVVEQLADQIIVTNDNPRHEDPKAIVADILRGFAHPERVCIELDRSKAIENSIQLASKQDCILIAGKGAEHYQQIGDVKIPFDDVKEVCKLIAEK